MKSAFLKYNEYEEAELQVLNAAYREFLDSAKTEREAVREAVRLAQSYGFIDLQAILREGAPLEPGDRVYLTNMGKGVLMAVIGEQPMQEGFNVIAAHVDSPRLDAKQNPLYEYNGLGYFDTHYYGGIKKYQWVTQPLALHGVIATKEGKVIDVVIGEGEDDPVFCVTDLLVHLSQDQLKKTGALVIEGEQLNVLMGSKPLDDEKDAVKRKLLAILGEKYGIEEEDFMSAELEFVPAGRAREMGLDRSMTIAYGQDDRSCAYPALEAIFGIEDIPQRTAVLLLVDKEEIGSVGATGMEAKFFENTVAEMMNAAGEYSELNLRRALAKSAMLSGDVTAALDPIYADAFEKNNSAYLGSGVCFSKFTGARGKSGSNDANAEYVAKLRALMDDAGVSYQMAELGKVDKGGGGTIAYICALYGMEVIDCGVPVLSMHAPYEVTSKADIYETYKCYSAFYTLD